MGEDVSGSKKERGFHHHLALAAASATKAKLAFESARTKKNAMQLHGVLSM